MDTTLEDVRVKLSFLLAPGAPPVTFIVGAGISIPSGIPAWPVLANDIAGALAEGHPRSSEFSTACKGMRPEAMFQAFYRVLGKSTTDAIRVMDPHRIRQQGAHCEPNRLHRFLAEVMKIGHIVVTTNFDDLIEEATGRSCKVVSSQSEIAGVIPAIGSRRYSGLVKLHGTFRKLDGSQSTDSIAAMLQEVQRAIPSHTKEVLDLLVGNRPVVVFGHSGLDDFDLYQRLLAVSTKTSPYILWIMHIDAEAEGDWRAYRGSDIAAELKSLQKLPRNSEYYKAANPLTVVQARDGILVKAHTREFLKQVFPQTIDWRAPDPVGEADKAVQELVRDWAASLSARDRQAVIASTFESSGPQFLVLAREQTELLFSSASTGMDKAARDLAVGRIIYKIGDAQRFDEAQSLLRSSADAFSQSGQVSQAAEAHLQLAMLLSRRAITEEATREMMTNATKAMGLYVALSYDDPGYLFELGIAFRAYALSIHRSLPDLEAVTNHQERGRCEVLLQLARKYADASLVAVDLAGNYLGERGQAQSLNIMGLIDQKIGSRASLAEAKDEFERVIDLSRRSGKGFEREEFQGHRNLGLALRGLARTGLPDQRTDLFEKAVDEFKLAEEKAVASDDSFNVKFNIMLLEVEAQSGKTDWGSILDRLVQLEPSIPKDRQKKPSWHWAAWVNATAARVSLQAQNPNEAVRRVALVTETYEMVSADQITNQTYGVQNGRTNIATCLEVLNSAGRDPLLLARVRHQANRLSALAQRIPEIQVTDPYPDPRSMILSISRH
jgi:NAD-dependent SIR2 family protein deacetylase